MAFKPSRLYSSGIPWPVRAPHISTQKKNEQSPCKLNLSRLKQYSNCSIWLAAAASEGGANTSSSAQPQSSITALYGTCISVTLRACLYARYSRCSCLDHKNRSPIPCLCCLLNTATCTDCITVRRNARLLVSEPIQTQCYLKAFRCRPQPRHALCAKL
jgi:hypothetical protein